MTLFKVNERWLYYAALLVFIIAKIPHLYQPFYWDESWVYAPAVSSMYEHGPSLVPGAIPAIYSRGHPTLFHASCAAWMYVFGNSHFSMHSFALLLSVLLAISIYEIMSRLFNGRVALMGGIMLLVNVTFFVESSLVLTDIAVALFAFLSLFCYTQRRYGLTVITVTLLYYMKESGWVMAFVIFADLGVDIIFRKSTRKDLLYKSITLVVPLTMVALFFIAQKHILGWYLFPEHTHIVDLGINSTLSKLQRSLSYVFYAENIYLFYLLLVLLWVALYVKTRKGVYISAAVGVCILYVHIIVFNYKDLVFYLFVVAAIGMLTVFFKNTMSGYDIRQERFIKLTIAFCIVFTYFSCVNFFEERYMFPALFLISIVLLPVFFDRVAAYFPKVVYLLQLCAIVLIGFSSFNAQSNELYLYERLAVQQKVVDFLEDNNCYDKNIACSILNSSRLWDAKTGFLRSKRNFPNLSEKVNTNTDIVIVDNIEYGDEYLAVMHNPSFKLLFRYENKRAWAEIYQKSKVGEVAEH